MNNILDKFKLNTEQEHPHTVITSVENGVVFRGTNLWILIFAIFVASLGLNVNSTAVIIGAMLISPLMGPIMGIGLAVGINDLALLKKAIYNFVVATGVALTTSTIFFSLSPLSDAHSEILARTAPNIYDVLIALFGGLAGILATSSKHKGNVIPGVAIATALMPPLCTAGYGVATGQLNYFFGAFYLFVINTVFIALATFIFVRFLNFPYKHLQNKRAETIAHRIIWSIVLLTLLPSLYFGYDMVQQNRFTNNANLFINNEAHFTNDYLLSKKINAKERTITLVFGGKEITLSEIDQLKSRIKNYNLKKINLEVKQGFAYLAENTEGSEQLKQLTEALAAKDKNEKQIRASLDSVTNQKIHSKQLYAELKAQYPSLKSAVIQPADLLGDTSGVKNHYLVLLSLQGRLPVNDKTKIENWMKVRLGANIILIFQ